jgi:protein-S-isoprenylcysteine O-methyltransferase Ste14
MTAEELQLRRIVVCASGLIYWGGVWIQARRIHRQIGRSPNLKPRGLREQALWLGWFVVIAGWVGQPFLVEDGTSNPFLVLHHGLLSPAVLIPGIALVLLGYACTLWCYAIMGNAWRIGINAKEKTALVRRGPFRHVRHPIYLFQIVMLAGAALLLPNAVSCFILALHCVCVLFKAADEEKYLATVYGAAYRDYTSVTGLLLPRFFRSRPRQK